MALELYNTSAPRGLKAGSTGFCTVAATVNMSGPMVEKLEMLGGYRPVFDVGSPEADRNPPAFAHWRASFGGHPYSILSHVCYAGADHRGRFNKLAHHLVVDHDEQVPAGPAWVMMQPDVMARQWSGEPRVLPQPKRIPDGPNPPEVCRGWEALTGDAGWAGMLANAFVLDATRPAYVLYEPGMDILPLINEALTLLGPPRRWQVTFSTYFDRLPAGLSCSWRCCVAGSPAARQAPGNATSGVLIDLTRRPLGPAPDNAYVRMARTGQPAPDAPPAPAPAPPAVAAEPYAFDEPAWERQAASEAQAPAAPDLAGAAAIGASAPAAGGPHPAARSSLLFWTVAIAWPIVVLAVGASVLWSSFGSRVGPSASTTSTDRLNEDLKDTRRLVATLEGQSEKLRGQLKALQDGKDKAVGQLRTQLQDAESRAREAESAREALQAELAKLKGGSAAGSGQRPTSSTQGSASSAGRTTGDQPPGPDVPKLAVGKCPSLSGLGFRRPQTLCRTLPGGKVRMILPAKLPEGFKLSQADGKATMTFVRKNSLGVQEDCSLATLEVKDGELVWQWQDASGHSEEVRRVRETVRYARVEVADGRGGTQLVQFVTPQEVPIPLAQRAAQRDLDCPDGVCAPVLVAVSDGKWKRQARDDSRALTFTDKVGVGFQVELRAGPKPEEHTTLVAFWQANSAPEVIGREVEKMGSQIGQGEQALRTRAKGGLSNYGVREPKLKAGATVAQQIKMFSAEARQAAAGCERDVREHEKKAGLTQGQRDLAALEKDLPKRPRDHSIDWNKQDQEKHAEKFKKYRQCLKKIADIKAKLHRDDAYKAKVNRHKGLARLRDALAAEERKLTQARNEKNRLARKLAVVTAPDSVVMRVETSRSKVVLAKVTVKIGGGTP